MENRRGRLNGICSDSVFAEVDSHTVPGWLAAPSASTAGKSQVRISSNAFVINPLIEHDTWTLSLHTVSTCDQCRLHQFSSHSSVTFRSCKNRLESAWDTPGSPTHPILLPVLCLSGASRVVKKDQFDSIYHRWLPDVLSR